MAEKMVGRWDMRLVAYLAVSMVEGMAGMRVEKRVA